MSDFALPTSNPAIQAILQSCPIAGEGVNHWLFCAALKLRRLGVKPECVAEQNSIQICSGPSI
jgi:hypothetical protein